MRELAMGLNTDDKFGCSNNWVYGFFMRNNLKRRMKTGAQKDLTEEKWLEVVDYLGEMCENYTKLQKEVKGRNGDMEEDSVRIFNFDETGVQFFGGSFTYDVKGSRTVKVAECKTPKVRFTVG
jgi:hypothetical protein